ncbi:MAG: amidohydrolase [Mesosutterella sp.]|nr:amidohydrolase [Mesosutterella sp.]
MTDEFDAYMPELIETRRRIHRRPETGWTEFETTALVAQRLESLGFEVHLGLEVIDPERVMGRSAEEAQQAEERARRAGVPEELLARMGGYTGCVGVLRTGRPGSVCAFRYDLDALPINEPTDPASGHLPAVEGFASVFPGKMHACGHDNHAAIGLAVARWARDHEAGLRGTLKLIFQPAEEGARGAAAMAARGVVDDADWLICGHVGTTAGPGELQIADRGFMATTKFDADFKGCPSHAGSSPEKGRSALLAAANAAVMLSAIPRTSQGDTRVAVGKLVSGSARNITPADAHMEFEVRGETAEANEFMTERAEEVVRGAASMTGVGVDLRRVGQGSTLVTTQAALDLLYEAARAVPGMKVMAAPPCPGSEDCTVLMHRVAQHGGNPGYFLFGCSHHGHHRPDFDTQDTVSDKPGFEMWVQVLKRILG